MLDLDTPQFPLSLSSKIAGQKHATGRQWYWKGWLHSDADQVKSASRGGTSLVSGRSVLAHAIAARLAARGVHPELACRAARGFTDASSDDRVPGKLFEKSFTVLVVYQTNDSDPSQGEFVVLHTPDGRVPVFFPPGGQTEFARYEDGMALMLDFIVKRVTTELEKAVGAIAAAVV